MLSTWTDLDLTVGALLGDDALLGVFDGGQASTLNWLGGSCFVSEHGSLEALSTAMCRKSVHPMS